MLARLYQRSALYSQLRCTASFTLRVALRFCSSKPHNIVVLTKPVEPGPEDCCQTGCVECVWEVYTRELQLYHVELAKLTGEAPPVDPLAELERRLYGKNNSKDESVQ